MDDSLYFDSFRIKASETDVEKRIKIPNLLNCLQEAAWTNASKHGFSTFDMLKHGITWVVNRLYIEFFSLPTYPGTISVETWPSGLDKYFAYRDFRVFDEHDKLLVQATSNWIVLDVKERKMIAVPEHVQEARFPVDRGGMERIKSRYTYNEDKTENEFSTNVSWFDLDINNHVNNTKYSEWVLDALGLELLQSRTIKSLDITFKAESGYGDQINSSCYEESENTYLHQVKNAVDGKVLVLAKTVVE